MEIEEDKATTIVNLIQTQDWVRPWSMLDYMMLSSAQVRWRISNARCQYTSLSLSGYLSLIMRNHNYSNLISEMVWWRSAIQKAPLSEFQLQITPAKMWSCIERLC